jgi:hypothetical protein
MTTEEKRNNVEDNYINGNLSDAAIFFKMMSKSDRREFTSDRACALAYVNEYHNEQVRKNAIKFVHFLISNL